MHALPGGHDVLRNALLTVVTILGLDISLALGGAIFAENVFYLPVTQGIVVFATLSIITITFFVDLAYAWIDPRVRLR